MQVFSYDKPNMAADRRDLNQLYGTNIILDYYLNVVVFWF
jgi:hypothetical protein